MRCEKVHSVYGRWEDLWVRGTSRHKPICIGFLVVEDDDTDVDAGVEEPDPDPIPPAPPPELPNPDPVPDEEEVEGPPCIV